jgi:hypothetical protein
MCPYPNRGSGTDQTPPIARRPNAGVSPARPPGYFFVRSPLAPSPPSPEKKLCNTESEYIREVHPCQAGFSDFLRPLNRPVGVSPIRRTRQRPELAARLARVPHTGRLRSHGNDPRIDPAPRTRGAPPASHSAVLSPGSSKRLVALRNRVLRRLSDMSFRIPHSDTPWVFRIKGVYLLSVAPCPSRHAPPSSGLRVIRSPWSVVSGPVVRGPVVRGPVVRVPLPLCLFIPLSLSPCPPVSPSPCLRVSVSPVRTTRRIDYTTN